MIRKILFININIIYMKMEQKAYCLLFLMLFWFVFGLKTRPFNGVKLNQIDAFSNAASVFLIFSGCLYFFDVNNFIKPYIFITLIVINVWYLMNISRICFKTYLLNNKNPKLKKVVLNFKNIYFSVRVALLTTFYRKNVFRYFRDIKREIRRNIHKIGIKKRMKFNILKAKECL